MRRRRSAAGLDLSTMSTSEQITFPPGTFGPDPLRLEVLARGEAWFALNKPGGILLAQDALHAEDAVSVVGAIHAAASAGKPQLAALGIAGCSRIHHLDAEVSGVAVLATSEAAAARLRNEQGSGAWEFVFELVAEADDLPDELTCELPLTRHMSQPRMIVSHRQGKQCATRFRRLRQLGKHAVWEARTPQNRLHQVRVHAAERGLRIVGEHLYARVRPVYLSSLKRHYRPGREEERPLHAGVALHLGEVRITAGSAAAPLICAPKPRSLLTLIKRLEESRTPSR